MAKAMVESKTLENSLKLVGEAFAPGASLMLDGRLREGAVHLAAGIGARLLLGPPALILSMAVRANSYSRSVTDKHLHEHFLTDSHATDEVPEQAAPLSQEDHTASEGSNPDLSSTAQKSPVDTSKEDDLKKIEGIGPKIAEFLRLREIRTFEMLAAMDSEAIRQLLAEAGSRYRLADPTTWPMQASLAAQAQWENLKALQKDLKSGRVLN